MASNFSGAPVDFTTGGDSYSSGGNKSGGRNSPNQYLQHGTQQHSGGSSVDFDFVQASRPGRGPVNDFNAFSEDDSSDDVHDTVAVEPRFDIDGSNAVAPSTGSAVDDGRRHHDALHYQQQQYDAPHLHAAPKLGSGSSNTHKRSVDSASKMHSAADAATTGARMSLGATSSGSVSPIAGVTGGSITGTGTVNHLRLWEKQHEAELLADREVESKERSMLRQQAAAELNAWKEKREADIRASVEELRAAEKTALQDADASDNAGGNLQGPAMWSAVWDIVDAVTCQQGAAQSTDEFSYMKGLLISLKENTARPELKML